MICSFEAFCDLYDTFVIGSLIGFTYCWRRQRLLMTTQVIKSKILWNIPTVRSQILCQLTAKMICELKSLTLADSEVRMPQVW